MKNIVEYINKLKNISIANNLLSNYEYKGNSFLGFLFSYLLYRKNNLDIPPISLFCYKINLIKITNEPNQIFKDIVDYFQNSIHIKPFLMLDIDLLGMNSNHFNLIIFNKQDNTLEHYEPNGYMSYEIWGIYSIYIERIVNILYKNLKRYIIDLKFKSSIELHGFDSADKEKLGLQSIEGRQNSTGHCQMWCYLIANLVIKFPEHSTESIIRRYLDLHNKDKLSKLNLHRKLKMIVRGFYFSSMKKLNKMDELGNLNSDTINTFDSDVLSQYNYSIKENIFLIFYEKHFNNKKYSIASTVKSYILTIGFEKTKSIFEFKSEKDIIISINERMKINKDEQFFRDEFILIYL
jgi:hypothetical protein